MQSSMDSDIGWAGDDAGRVRRHTTADSDICIYAVAAADSHGYRRAGGHTAAGGDAYGDANARADLYTHTG